MKIVETFYSIQGEGKFAGTPAFFIRFFGCNLKCDFGNGMVCDDKAHSNKSLVREVTIKDLLDELSNTHAKHVVLTGGEVSLHNVNELIRDLQKNGYYVQVETNGTSWDNIIEADYITYSPKGFFDASAPKLQAGFHEVKVLAGINNPLDPNLFGSVGNKYIQPIGFEHEWDMDNVNYCIEFVKANPSWKLSLQTHKAAGVR